MGGGSMNKNGSDGGKQVAAAHGLPAAVWKVVQSVKEIVDCTEEEIYDALKECDMDPNRAVEKLLAQDTFREVRSRRERRKEMKEANVSRTRAYNVGLSRGGKTGIISSHSVVPSRLTHVTYNEHGKSVDKGEGGPVMPPVPSSATHVVEKSTKCDYFSTDNRRQSLGKGDSMLDSSQLSSGPQTSMMGVSKGLLSMADIVRMGSTSQDAVSHNQINTSEDSACGNSESKQQISPNDWPVIEQPIARNSQALSMSASSNANEPSQHPSLHVTAVCLPRNCELDATQVSRGDGTCDNVISEKKESASLSSKHSILSSNPELWFPSNSNLRSNSHEDVSSAASVLRRLSIGESKQTVPEFEDDPSVVIPDHLQALGAYCSHLSFGSYSGSSSSASSLVPTSNHLSRSGLDEKSAALDDSLAQFLDASSVYHGEKQLGFDARGTDDKNWDFLSSPQQEFVKHIGAEEESLENVYNMMASASDPSLQKSHWVNPSLSMKHPGFHGGNPSTFLRDQYSDSNLRREDVLALLESRSQSARRSNVVSSIGNPAMSKSEVMDPGAFAIRESSALPQDPTMQAQTNFHQLPDKRGGYRSLPQSQSSFITAMNSQQAFSGNTAYNHSPADLKYNLSGNIAYNQSSADLKYNLSGNTAYNQSPADLYNLSGNTAYNQSPADLKYNLSGNTAYNQSPADLKYNLQQNRNEFQSSRLPPTTARDAFGRANLGSSFSGRGNLGSSFSSPGNVLSNPSLGYMTSQSNFDEILRSQYNDGRNLGSIQPPASFSHWDHGVESRSSIRPEGTGYNFLGQPNQASLLHHARPGNSYIYSSQAQVLDELQEERDFKDLSMSSKQLDQFWQQHRR